MAAHQERLPSTYLSVFISAQLRLKMRCKKQATAHRILSFKYATGGGSSHEPHPISRVVVRVSWSIEWVDRGNGITCLLIFYISRCYPLPPTTPGRWHGECWLTQCSENTRWRDGLEVVESSRLKDTIASVVVDARWCLGEPLHTYALVISHFRFLVSISFQLSIYILELFLALVYR